MSCKCVKCSNCKGNGTLRVWVSGLDELAPCEECGASGIVEICDECREKMEEEDPYTQEATP